jgi:hypothetical protein
LTQRNPLTPGFLFRTLERECRRIMRSPAYEQIRTLPLDQQAWALNERMQEALKESYMDGTLQTKAELEEAIRDLLRNTDLPGDKVIEVLADIKEEYELAEEEGEDDEVSEGD